MTLHAEVGFCYDVEAPTHLTREPHVFHDLTLCSLLYTCRYVRPRDTLYVTYDRVDSLVQCHELQSFLFIYRASSTHLEGYENDWKWQRTRCASLMAIICVHRRCRWERKHQLAPAAVYSRERPISISTERPTTSRKVELQEHSCTLSAL